MTRTDKEKIEEASEMIWDLVAQRLDGKTKDVSILELEKILKFLGWTNKRNHDRLKALSEED